MQVTFVGKSTPLSEREKEYASRKLQRLSRYFRSVRDAFLTHGLQRGLHQVEVTLDLDGILLRAESRDSDVTACIDQVVDKLEEQVRRLKERLKKHRGRADAPTVASALLELPEEEGGAGQETSLPAIVRRKRISIKPMTSEEAALQMELLNHDFFAYQDADSGQVHILYRRQDGNYGLLELEG